MAKFGQRQWLAAAHRQTPPPAAASAAAEPLQPSDRDPTIQIQSEPKLKSRVPVNRALFAQEPLCFSKFNPQFYPVQKYLQNSPYIYVLAPDPLGFHS